MFTALLKTKSRLGHSLGGNLWNEFEYQDIPFHDRIEILARRNNTLFMHISVIKEVSGIEFLDSCEPFHLSENSASRSLVDCLFIDVKFIKYVARLMYLGSVCVPKEDLAQFFCACSQFKIGYVDNGDLEPAGQIVMAGAAGYEHQANNAVIDVDVNMDIDEQPEADLGASGGQQSSASNINNNYTNTHIIDTFMIPFYKHAWPRSDKKPARKTKQLDSDMTPEDEVPAAKRFKPC